MARLKQPLHTLDNASLFDFVAKKKRAGLIDLGVGDIVHPLIPEVAKAMCDATLEMAYSGRGYGPKAGYPFLREAIHAKYYSRLPLTPDDIFVNDGIIGDFALFFDLLEGRVAIQDPCYPPQVGNPKRVGMEVELLPCNEENGFKPDLPKKSPDIIVLCSPHNPTGVALTRADLKKWVDYALEQNALILFDAAYQPFITSPDVPKTIYEIEGSEKVAVEFCSFSKGAGFTGLRCGYFVCPVQIEVDGKSLQSVVNQVKSMCSNGVAYPIQKGAEASLDCDGFAKKYMPVACYMQKELRAFGGVDSPYLWMKIANGMTSLEYFEYLVDKHNLLLIPGSGFGEHGEGYMRISSFVSMKVAKEAVAILKEESLVCKS